MCQTLVRDDVMNAIAAVLRQVSLLHNVNLHIDGKISNFTINYNVDVCLFMSVCVCV